MTDDLHSTLRRIDEALSTPEPERDGWGGFFLLPLLAHGARVAVTDDDEPTGTLAPFTVIGSAREPHDAPPTGAKLPDAGEVAEFDIECMVPSARWSPEDQAWFWRVKAKAFWFNFGDASLNLTADAIERALPWHIEHAPADAALLWAARLRAKLYASYSSTEVAEELRRLFTHSDPLDLDPSDERHFILQVVEIVDRIRASEPTFESDRLLATALRGLELFDAGGESAQISRLHHAVADALFERDVEPVISAALAERYGEREPAAIARRAWERALALEDGAFYGTVEAHHREARERQYRERLARLELTHGDPAAGIEALAALLGEISSPYDARHALRHAISWMRDRGIDRAQLLERVLRRQILEREPEADEWRADMLLKLVRYIDYQLADIGAGAGARALLGAAYDQPWIAEAVARAKKAANASQGLGAAEQKLLDALFAVSVSGGEGPPSAAIERERRLLESLDAVVRDAQAELLLFRDRESIGDAVELSYVANVPEHAADTLRAELAPVIRGLESAVRALYPDADVRVAINPLALGPGLSDQAELAFALGRAGATRTLKALDLEPRELDVDVDALAKAMGRRIITVQMELR